MVKRIFCWLEYILCLLFFAFIWIFFEKYGLFIIVVLWALFPFYSYAVMKNAAKNCSFSLGIKNRVIGREEENTLILNIENKGIFAQGRIRLLFEIEDVFFGEKSEFTIEVPLHSGNFPGISKPAGSLDAPSRAVRKVEIPIYSLYSGVRQIRLKKAEFPSMMGLFLLKKTISMETEYVVMPVKLILNDVVNAVSGTGNDELPDDDVKGNNSSQIREITDYKPGDRLQKIHWKATAKKGELMVKEYEGTLTDQVTLIVELVRDRKVLEDILRLTFAVASIKIAEIQKITIQWWNNPAGEWKKLILTSEEELEQGLEELFYCSSYDNRQQAYEQVIAEGELAGSVIYISDENSEGIMKNKRIELSPPPEEGFLAGASVLTAH